MLLMSISMYKVILSKQAVRDLGKLKQAGAVYSRKAKELVDIVADDPYQNPPPYKKLVGDFPPPYKKLVGDLQGYYSRRINEQHRFVYAILPNNNGFMDENENPYKGIVHVLKMWTHYE